MAEYTFVTETNIATALEERGHVSVYSLPGCQEDEADELLRRYVELHGSERPLFYDGTTLSVARLDEVAVRSPVEEILSMPREECRFDTPPAEGRVAPGILWLPVILALPGGAFAWFLLRGTHPRAARYMFYTGLAITLVEAVVVILALKTV